jgi:hypothetical protein
MAQEQKQLEYMTGLPQNTKSSIQQNTKSSMFNDVPLEPP